MLINILMDLPLFSPKEQKWKETKCLWNMNCNTIYCYVLSQKIIQKSSGKQFVSRIYWKCFRCARNMVRNTEGADPCYSKIKLCHPWCLTKTILAAFLWEESHLLNQNWKIYIPLRQNPLVTVYLITVYIKNTKKRISSISKHDEMMWIHMDVTIFAQVIKKLVLLFKDWNSDLTLSRKIWIYPIFIWSFELVVGNIWLWILYVILYMDLEVSRSQWVNQNYKSNFRSHLMNGIYFPFICLITCNLHSPVKLDTVPALNSR